MNITKNKGVISGVMVALMIITILLGAVMPVSADANGENTGTLSISVVEGTESPTIKALEAEKSKESILKEIQNQLKDINKKSSDLITDVKFIVENNNNNEINEINLETDESGTIIKNLPYGEYKLIQIKTAEGYEFSEKELTVNISKENPIVYASVQNKKVASNEQSNGVKEGKVTIKYKDTKGLEIFKSEVIKGSVGNYWDFKEYEKTFAAYNFVEVVGIESQYFTETPQEVVYIYKSASDNSNTTKNSVDNITGTYEIKGQKVDEKGQPLTGVKFGLYNDKGELLQETISDNNGLIIFKTKHKGKYIIKETEALKGYHKSSDVVEINIDDNYKNPTAPTFIINGVKAIKTGVNAPTSMVIMFAISALGMGLVVSNKRKSSLQ